MNIITHTSPDWDAIGAVWLLKRYGGMADADVLFLNTGNPPADVLATADAVVDTGRSYSPEIKRFDHHHLPGQAANETCATMQVYAWLWDIGAPECYKAIAPIAQLILSGDTGRSSYGADWSRQIGIHALLSAERAKRRDDYELLGYGFDLLDNLAAHLIASQPTATTASATAASA